MIKYFQIKNMIKENNVYTYYFDFSFEDDSEIYVSGIKVYKNIIDIFALYFHREKEMIPGKFKLEDLFFIANEIKKHPHFRIKNVTSVLEITAGAGMIKL